MNAHDWRYAIPAEARPRCQWWLVDQSGFDYLANARRVLREVAIGLMRWTISPESVRTYRRIVNRERYMRRYARGAR